VNGFVSHVAAPPGPEERPPGDETGPSDKAEDEDGDIGTSNALMIPLWPFPPLFPKTISSWYAYTLCICRWTAEEWPCMSPDVYDLSTSCSIAIAHGLMDWSSKSASSDGSPARLPRLRSRLPPAAPSASARRTSAIMSSRLYGWDPKKGEQRSTSPRSFVVPLFAPPIEVLEGTRRCAIAHNGTAFPDAPVTFIQNETLAFAIIWSLEIDFEAAGAAPDPAL
jgi:hypothetical protein